MRLRASAITLVAAVSGCASVSPEGAFKGVQSLARERLGHEIRWDRGEGGDKEANEVAERVSKLLSAPLSTEAAIEVALLRHRGLQAIYEDLGVAQADLVQAGLLKNPRLGLGLDFPVEGNASVGFGVSLVQEFLDLFLIPLRNRLAGRQLEEAQLGVVTAVLKHAGEVRKAWLLAVGTRHELALLEEVNDAQRAAAEISGRQHEAGNVDDLELVIQLDASESQRLVLARLQAESSLQTTRLARLMGLWGPESELKLPERLPEVPAVDPDLSRLEARAIAERLDLRAAFQRRDVLAYALSIERGTRFIPALALGFDWKRESVEGIHVVGPTLGLELPIFDQGRARVARLEAELRRSERLLEDLATEVRTQIVLGCKRLVAGRALLDHQRSILLPLRERIVQETQLKYNAMGVSVYRLLTARQNQLSAYGDSIAAARDYWLARADLDLAVGGMLDRTVSGPLAR